MKKIKHFAEAAWVLGVILIGLGVALVTKGGFGVSMVVAPAYIIHLVVEKILPWYSFGTSEYILQGVLVVALWIVIKKFKPKFLLSFLTAVIYGFVLDGWFWILGGSAPYEQMYMRIISLAAGIIVTSLSIALFFRTYLPQQVYELFVAQIAKKFGKDTSKTKWVYDISSLTVSIIGAIIVSVSFDDIRFTDCIGIGTVACTVFNAPLISLFGKALDKLFVFDAKFPALETKFNI